MQENSSKKVSIEDLRLLTAIQDHLSGKVQVYEWSMLASNRTKKKLYTDAMRRSFNIPEHIPYAQFEKYLRELERRLKCLLSKK